MADRARTAVRVVAAAAYKQPNNLSLRIIISTAAGFVNVITTRPSRP